MLRPFSIATFPGFRTLAYPFTVDFDNAAVASINDGFEYSSGWPGTIANAAYPETFTGFSTPDASLADGFENADGWPGT